MEGYVAPVGATKGCGYQGVIKRPWEKKGGRGETAETSQRQETLRGGITLGGPSRYRSAQAGRKYGKGGEAGRRGGGQGEPEAELKGGTPA